MANHKYRRDIDRAFAHALEHCESAKISAETGNITNIKINIDLAENIIRQAQKDSKKSKRRDDKNNGSGNKNGE